jgi:hypothetical protein
MNPVEKALQEYKQVAGGVVLSTRPRYERDEILARAGYELFKVIDGLVTRAAYERAKAEASKSNGSTASKRRNETRRKG